MEVFRALAAWTEFHPAARQPRLAPRLARCVRLPSLSLPELYVLGDHPLVSLADHLLLENKHHHTCQLPKAKLWVSEAGLWDKAPLGGLLGC